MDISQNQLPNSVMMIEPASFACNEETIGTNHFQTSPSLLSTEQIAQNARKEFRGAVESMVSGGLQVEVFSGTKSQTLPDEVFPNNWVSFHPSGKAILYPMFAKNRRLERRRDILTSLQSDRGYVINEVIDYSHLESNNQFLEGTGSVVFDYKYASAFACLSKRTDRQLFYTLCEELGIQGFLFSAEDEKQQAIYHTNVIMSIGDGIVLYCEECITRHEDKVFLETYFREREFRVVQLTFEQIKCFAGNMYQVRTSKGEPLLLMSTRAEESLTRHQRDEIGKSTDTLSLDVQTIETFGGGSIRCMVAGIFLPRVEPA